MRCLIPRVATVTRQAFLCVGLTTSIPYWGFDVPVKVDIRDRELMIGDG